MASPQKSLHYFLTLLCFIGFYCGFTASVFAQNSSDETHVTPTHVYQSTEKLRLKLTALGLIDVQLYETGHPDSALRHPRHVIQKVRECHQIISKALKTRNLDPAPIPELFSVREIRPLDVKNGVEHLLGELQKIDSAPMPPPPPTEQEKLPLDVYNNLNRICHALNMPIEPSDVYQVAHAVRENMEKIAHSQGYNANIGMVEFHAKTPANVHAQTRAFLDDLRLLALNPDYAIPGGVIIPSIKTGEALTPTDAVSLMNDALAATGAIKYTLRLHEQTSLPPYKADKTPSDVFAQIHHAHQIVKYIIEKEAALDSETQTP